jgi:hypothetical protein
MYERKSPGCCCEHGVGNGTTAESRYVLSGAIYGSLGSELHNRLHSYEGAESTAVSSKCNQRSNTHPRN